jgi:hypothetical protein
MSNRRREIVPRRIYIYRALTAVRKSAYLPPSADADVWRLWMQIGPSQAQRGTFGFDIRTAVNAINTYGYYLFTGAAELLRDATLLLQAEPRQRAIRCMTRAARRIFSSATAKICTP